MGRGELLGHMDAARHLLCSASVEEPRPQGRRGFIMSHFKGAHASLATRTRVLGRRRRAKRAD